MRVTSIASSEVYATPIESGLTLPRQQAMTSRPISSWSFSPLRMLGLLSLCLGVRGQLFPAQIELSSLNGTDGFVINGEASGDWLGGSVSGAGDVNGDGVADILMGAYHADPTGGRESAGRTYVVFGKAGLGARSTLELSSLDGISGFIFNGDKANDQSGISVSSVGDMNDDGVADLAIGANQPGSPNAGKVYVVFGKSGLGAGGVIELSSLDGTNGFTLNGDKTGDWSGISVSGAGDTNGDGVADLLIGAFYARAGAGKSYVVFGKRNLGADGNIELSTLNGTSGFTLNGDKAGDYSGLSVSGAGDVNGDGIADLLIGARGADPAAGREEAGKSYVVFGKPGLGTGGVIELSSLDGVIGFTLHGDQTNDQNGNSVSSAGDVNDDGMADLLIGAPAADAGKSYVVFGRPSLGSDGTIELSRLNSTSGLILNGDQSKDSSGYSVASADDVNGDGVADLAIGAFHATPAIGREEAGKTYVVFGRSDLGAGGTLELSSLNGMNGFVLNGDKMRDGSGVSVSSAGDINADGIADILIGAYRGEPAAGREEAGKTYVVFGRKPTISTSTNAPMQTPSLSSADTAIWSALAPTTDVGMTQATVPLSGPDGTVIALVAAVVGLALSMCGGAGLLLRQKWKTREKETQVALRTPVYEEVSAEPDHIYAVLPGSAEQRQSNYSDWPRKEEESVYQELELRKGSHYVQNMAEIMPDGESPSESTS